MILISIKTVSPCFDSLSAFHVRSVNVN